MLRRVRLKNFKAWEEVDLELGSVTGLFGANSAGKTSLLQFLLLLKQTRNATDRGLVLDFGGTEALVDLGAFEDVLHRHDRRRRLRWTLDWTVSDDLKIADPDRPRSELFRGNLLANRGVVGLRDESPWPYELSYCLEDRVELTLRTTPGSDVDFELQSRGSNFEFQRNVGRAWPLPRPVKTHLFPGETRSYYRNAAFLSDFELAYEKLMDSIYYLGPLREHPKREYRWRGSRPQDVGRRGEYTLDAMLAATHDNVVLSLGYRKWRKPFQGMIAHWLRELGLIHDFCLEEIGKGSNYWRAQVLTSPSSVETGLTDVGFGVSQVLPALVLLYYVPQGSTVLMEQPEIHLHPAVQAGLADLMLNVAQTRELQILVESHSEHLMRRLQRRVAEGSASATDVKLYFVSSDDGAARLSDLALNEFGEIGNWPRHFFGDEMGEVAAIAEAGMTRRMESQV
ncbi:MAG: DUF3696 domain-containing protein [Gammaproteobacteria bacterium]|nr:DUF3696 domain-containing protein [Gammaproteobacteria bacterium]MDE0274024.1 DUF3696 domain-containing protein [Gammaproteobacteria bacterium]